MLPIIALFMEEYKGEQRLFVQYTFNTALNAIVKKIPGAKWSQTRKSWHVPPGDEVVTGLKKDCQGLAQIDTRGLNGRVVQNPIQAPVKAVVSTPASKTEKIQVSPSGISANNSAELTRLTDHLKLKSYGASTIKTYRNEFRQLLLLLGDVPVQDLQPEHLKRYLIHCTKISISENTIHSRLNALKFYFEQVLHHEKFFFDIPRPKKHTILPRLLNEDELSRLFNALSNKKHKVMLFTCYSAGLRVSEIVQLKLSDIDSGRMQIFIRKAKGKKDRYVALSPVLLDILRQYVRLYKPKPLVYLFESERTGTAYPIRTVQQIFVNAKNKAGIKKEVGIHSLRHSFATHLLEKGVDIKFIKDLLGHLNIKTTERYLHVSKSQLINIVSPFDTLWEKNKIEW